MYQQSAYIRDMYIQLDIICICIYVVLIHGGGGVFYRQNKSGGESAVNTWNTLCPTENYIKRSLFDKNVKFCKVVFHDLTNDISYNAKLNRSKFAFWGKNSKKYVQKS